MGAKKVTFHVDFNGRACTGSDFKADPDRASVMRAALAVKPGAFILLISYRNKTVWGPGGWGMTNEQLKKLA